MLNKIEAALGGRGLAVPFAYVVARTAQGQSVVVAGTDFERVQKLDRWWSVSAWPSGPREALMGMRALPVASPDGKEFELSFQGHTIRLRPAEHSRPEPRKTAGSICRWPNSLHGVACDLPRSRSRSMVLRKK